MATPNKPQPDSESTLTKVNEAVGFVDHLITVIKKHPKIFSFVLTGFVSGTGGLVYQHKQIQQLQPAVTVTVENDSNGELKVLESLARENRRLLLDLRKDYETTKRNFH